MVISMEGTTIMKGTATTIGLATRQVIVGPLKGEIRRHDNIHRPDHPPEEGTILTGDTMTILTSDTMTIPIGFQEMIGMML
jgi:hypothetical protein